MKRYKVYVYNTEYQFRDSYEVDAENPVDAKKTAVQKLADETGTWVNEYEVTGVKRVDKND